MKGGQKIAEPTLENNRPFGRVAIHNGQIVLLAEMLDLIEVFLVGAMLRLEFLVGRVFPFC
jgi:hypothetical protein